MFYGGSLLCYLTGNDDEGNEELKEFIALRRLNRNSVVVMDSDKTSTNDPVGDCKLRIKEEFKDDGLSWITAGRTIENYLSADHRREAFLNVHRLSGEKVGGGGQFHTVKKGGGKFEKIKMARAAVSLPVNLDVLDLEERINEMVKFIRKCNPNMDHVATE